MFGKRKEDRKFESAEAEASGELPEAEAGLEPHDPELAEALLQLGRNRGAPLPEPQWDTPSELDVPAGLDTPSKPDDPGAPDASVEPLNQDVPADSDPSEALDAPVWSGVPTAAMLAEPEPEVVEPGPTSAGDRATQAALKRERAMAAERESALRATRDQVGSLQKELKQLRAGSAPDAAELQAATARTGELEQSLRESQARIEELTAEVDRLQQSSDADAQLKEAQNRTSELEQAQVESQARVDALTAELEEFRASGDADVVELRSQISALKVELERARSEAAASGVTLDRVEREANEAAEIARLRAEATEPAQASHAQAEAALAENRQLASDLAANIKSQEGLIAALIGLQAEVTEQRAWFESQIAKLGETESQQTGLVASLQAAIQDRDTELELLRQQLLEAETKRAEEAAAFVAALERQ